jgi:two-component system NtrC family sensor kinase
MSSSNRPIHESQLLPRLQSLEDRLEKVSAETLRLQRLAMLGTVCAGIAHEINNLLTPAMGYVQLARNAPDDVDLQGKALEKSATALETTAKIVRSMLGLGTGDDQDVRADVATVVADALACIGRAPTKGIKVTIDVPPDLAARIRPVALQQILMNLSLNALEAMQGQSGTLTIRARAEEETIRIEVRDSGPGIPAHIAQSLFHPFVTTPTTGQPCARKGTGLGLTICRDLVDEADGTIRVESSGEGAIFTVTLPPAPAESRKAG